ncbi:MAG TPA: fused MFS/spermidine synthase [Polyangia bacterium]
MRAVLLACFFLSGSSGLILEMLWTRKLGLVFGSTTLAISTVLATFMGGLGLGSYVAGRYADRLKNPVRAYALAEAAIGLYALMIPVILWAYPSFNGWMYRVFGDRWLLLSMVRFVGSAGLLLIPTTLMGATLPLLSRHFVMRPWELRRSGLRIGSLYAVNLFGAVAGAFFAGFVFLPLIGVTWTNITAATFNLTLATAIVIARRRMPDADVDAATAEERLDEAAVAAHMETTALPPPPDVTARARRAVMGAFAISGATAMCLQVLWTRSLAILLGSSIFSFTLILLAFLIGLGAGAAIFARLSQRTPHPVLWLAVLHIATAAAIGATYLFTDKIPYIFTWLLQSSSFGVDAILFCQFVLACITVLPATLLMGGVFPLTVRVVTGGLESVGKDVGNAYALNTLGAIVGSFLSGFIVLPRLGLEKGIYAAVLFDLALAAMLFGVAPALPRRHRQAGVAAAVAMALLGLVIPRWDLGSFSSGFFRVSIAREYVYRKIHKRDWKTPELVFYEDGMATTVSVDRWDKIYSLKNNGKVDASNDADMPTQIIVGLLPFLFYSEPHPPKVALVGYGSGVTAGAITQYPIASLEVVELEEAVYRGSRFFENDNHRPLQNPKVNARVGDGRNFLTQRSDKFDVIVSEPSNPWLTGVSNLFTREYFKLVKTRLGEHGIFCQWAQLYEMAPWNIKTILGTVRSEFPYVYVFAAEDWSSDTILIGSRDPLPLDYDVVERAFRDPVTRAEARRGGFNSPHDVFAYVLLGPDELEAFTAGAPLNTDDNARIEFAAPRDLLGYAKFEPYRANVYGPMWPYGRLSELVRGYGDGPNKSSRCGGLARSLLAHGKAREAELWTRRAEAAGDSPEARHARMLLDLVSTRLDRDPEIPLAPGEELEPPTVPGYLADKHPELVAKVKEQYPEVLAHYRARRYVTGYKVLEDWPEDLWAGLGKDFSLLTGFLDYKAEIYADAIDELKALADDATYVARRPELLYYLGRSYYAASQFTKAVDTLERYVRSQTVLGRDVLPSAM